MHAHTSAQEIMDRNISLELSDSFIQADFRQIGYSKGQMKIKAKNRLFFKIEWNSVPLGRQILRKWHTSILFQFGSAHCHVRFLHFDRQARLICIWVKGCSRIWRWCLCAVYSWKLRPLTRQRTWCASLFTRTDFQHVNSISIFINIAPTHNRSCLLIPNI